MEKQQYGYWTIIGKSDKSGYVKCRCICGIDKEVNLSSLRLGKSKSCGCSQKGKKKEYLSINRLKGYKEKYIGIKINNIDILDVINENGRILFECKCDCGKVFKCYKQHILNGNTTSCGHDREVNLRKGNEIVVENSVEGTNLLSLKTRVDKSKINKNSTTKVNGVAKLKSGKYRAYINLKRKQYHLGCFNTIEEAITARKEAEEKFFKPIIEKYKG